MSSTSTLTCPKCASAQLREMGQSLETPPTSILRCDRCGHVWMPETASPVPAPATGRCPKCDSVRMRFLGRSASGVAYSRCDECDHLVIGSPANS